MATRLTRAGSQQDGRYELSGYDATTTKARRKVVSINLRSEDDHLLGADRQKLQSSSRDLERNYSAAGWMIRRHLDYTTSFNFQSRTGDDALDDEIESIVAWYARPVNCDVLGRFGLYAMARMMEERAIVDGDVFLLKLSTGHLQAIESDRIYSQNVKLPKQLKDSPREIINGVQIAKSGKPTGYILTSRDNYGRFVFERFLKAAFVIQHGYWTRFDQLRGISPLAPAINNLRDLYESGEYALAKMKLSQLLGLVFYREDMGDFDGTSDEPYELNFADSLATLQLDPGDKVETLESKNPSQEFQGFADKSIMLALKALDIPFCHWDEGSVNYAGGRRADQGYEQSAKQKRGKVRGVLDHIIRWRLGLFIQDGVLQLPSNMTLGSLKWELINTSVAWYLDPRKEVLADTVAVDAGFISTPEVAKMRGRDAFAIATEEKKYRDHRAKLGLPNSSQSAASSLAGDTDDPNA